MKCTIRIGGARLPSSDWLLVCMTLAFAAYLAYEFELLTSREPPCSRGRNASSDGTSHRHHPAGRPVATGAARESGTRAATAAMIAEASSRWPGRKFPTVA